MDKKEDANQYYQQGILMNRHEKAVISFTRAIKSDKANLLSHFGIAVAKEKQEKFQCACSLYKIYLLRDPQNAAAYYNLGYIYDMLGNSDEGIEMYKTALVLNPEHADGYYNLAITFTIKENYEEAQKHFLKALELQPLDADKILNCVGYSYFLQGDFEKAKIELQKSRDFNKKYLVACCNMSLVLFCENRCQDACELFEEGMKILENDQNAQTKIIKDCLESYSSEKVRLEAKLKDDEEIMDEGKRSLLKTLINGLVNMMNLLSQKKEK